MEIIQIPIGHMGNLSYIAFDTRSRNAFMVDASWEPDKLSETIKRENLNLKAILLTHGHFDHTNAVPSLIREFPDIPVYMREEDRNLPENPFQFKNPEGKNPIAEFPEIEMIYTPGHTSGSVCWIIPEDKDSDGIIFTGDTLFAGACGRIDFPESMPHKMHGTLKQLSQMPGGMIVYPGHSYNKSASTIEQEIRTNPYMKAAMELSGNEFIEMMMY